MKSYLKKLSRAGSVAVWLAAGIALAADDKVATTAVETAVQPAAAAKTVDQTAAPHPAAAAAPATTPSAQPNSMPVIVTRDHDVYTLRAEDATVADILAALKAESEVDIEVDPSILDNKLTLNMSGVPYEKIIEVLAGSHALIYEKTESGYRLTAARLTGQQEYIVPPLPDLSRKEQRNVKALTAQAKKLLVANGKIIQDAGELDYDQAKALIAERDKKFQEIIDELAKLGPGGARAMLDATTTDTGTRDLLAVIKALGLVDDPEASAILGQLYGEQDKYSLQREIVGALGHRKDADTVATLESILNSTDDERLRAGVLQALSGRPEALKQLLAIVDSAADTPDVRAEAIRSIGLIADDASRSALTAIAGSASYGQVLRKAAIQELGRSFGSAAIPALKGVLADQDEAVRQSAVRALSKIVNPESTALLRTVATGDVSSVVRAHAEAALSARGASTVVPASPN